MLHVDLIKSGKGVLKLNGNNIYQGPTVVTDGTGPALNAVVNNAAAQSMTLVQRNSFVGDILSSHFAERFGLTNGEDALKPPLEGGNKRLVTGGCCANERQEVSESLSCHKVTEGVLMNQEEDHKTPFGSCGTTSPTCVGADQIDAPPQMMVVPSRSD